VVTQAWPALPASAPPSRLAFWRDALDGAPSDLLPAPASGRASDPQWSASRIAFEFDDALVRRARSMSLDAHATLPMLLHAALNVAFYRVTGALDQPVGVLASTRELTGDAARHALGLFINAVVVRTRLTRDDSPATILNTVRDTALASYAHADTPFADVVAALSAPRAGLGNPLFQVMFNYLRPAGAANRDWAGLALDEFNDVRHRVVFELELDIVEHPDGRVTGAFSYANELVDAAFVEALSSDYLAAVQQFVDAPHDALGEAHALFACTPHVEAAPQPLLDTAARAKAQRAAQALERVWRDLFDGQSLSHDDDLFEAGATSFDVVRFVDAAQRAGFAIEISDVFATPNFAGLGRHVVREALVPAGAEHAPAINQ
jgi:non-ribosomal peptide synthetase component F